MPNLSATTDEVININRNYITDRNGLDITFKVDFYRIAPIYHDYCEKLSCIVQHV